MYNQRSSITFYINKLPGTADIYSAQCHYTKNTVSDQPEVSISENRALFDLSHSYRHIDQGRCVIRTCRRAPADL